MSSQRPPGIVEQSDRIQKALFDRGIIFELKNSGGADTEHLLVELPGERKLRTNVLLTVGKPGVRIEAFVCRRPDEDHEKVYRFLLKRNRRLYGVAYTIDNIGDIYLVGRVAADSVTADELDRLLGQVLEAADGDFNTLLEIGFHTSIRREWAWRTARGESLNNLLAFEHLIDKESLPEIPPLKGSGPAGSGPAEVVPSVTEKATAAPESSSFD
ncbi:YbjN domain-containing protein [Williamsia sp. CHRR-6]|uniref:YbjN domain-containing protein n=1 Tax=Williamsia sp. CHRR-6 TaxID=2835871 RepID=UPI001BD9D3CA|nr:YbjN domain-containing protein [Williamsia sp. CHRR-6]MBT0566003.1 YbjN domain-containing protein [Williamsia sp. CHRR-6]